ncbi:MAG: GNAT family N-acetyltransferase [Spirochaetota bacterium]
MAPARSPDIVIRPASTTDGLEVWSMIQEIGPGENGFHNAGYGVPFSRFERFLMRLVEAHLGRGLPEGHVPQTTYWGFAGDHPIGIVKLRHWLTDALRQTGGHIGYSIRPHERRRGYAVQMLGCALREASRRGIDRALITVNEENRASWRVVEANGGELVQRSDGKRYYETPTS